MSQKARVLVTIKKDVLDPAGTVVKKALGKQGLSGVLDVRIGKIIDITFDPDCDAIQQMPALALESRSLLSNPIVEDFSIQLVDEN
jgi:phosphoribosylformylglycinamidine synthase subunit PurS